MQAQIELSKIIVTPNAKDEIHAKQLFEQWENDQKIIFGFLFRK